jgi:hypothetical protein
VDGFNVKVNTPSVMTFVAFVRSVESSMGNADLSLIATFLNEVLSATVVSQAALEKLRGLIGANHSSGICQAKGWD